MSRSAQPRAEGGADHALPRVSGPGLIRRSREASSARARPVARLRARPRHCEGGFPRETHVRLSTRVCAQHSGFWGTNKAHFFSRCSFPSNPRVSPLSSLLKCREIASHAKLSRDGHPFRTTAPPLSIVRGAMVATLACAPVTFTASAPRARGRVPASRSRAARSGAPARSIEARATAEATVSETSVAFAAHETPCRVYIEHTDAYQVVYHANYFKFLARGREEALFGARGEEIVAALRGRPEVESQAAAASGTLATLMAALVAGLGGPTWWRAVSPRSANSDAHADADAKAGLGLRKWFSRGGYGYFSAPGRHLRLSHSMSPPAPFRSAVRAR